MTRILFAILAMAATLLGQSHAPASAKALKNPLKSTDTELAGGKALFEQKCAGCHGLDGKSQTAAAAKMKIKPADLTGHNVSGATDGEIYWVVTHGIKLNGMPGFQTEFMDLERWEITLYVRRLGSLHN